MCRDAFGLEYHSVISGSVMKMTSSKLILIDIS